MIERDIGLLLLRVPEELEETMAGRKMDLYKVAADYLDEILGTGDSNGTDGSSIRVLILDSNTAPIISLVSTQSELLKREIYLVDRLENTRRDKLRNLKCICYLSPSDASITHLSQEIGTPKYGNYKVYFNNIISKSRLERLAESDDLEIVDKVAEVFQDYFVLNKCVFTATNSFNPVLETQTWDPVCFENSLQSLTSLLLSLNMKPVIQYENNSKMAAKLANAINYEMNSNSQLFDDLLPDKDIKPLLLILDRKNDPITPLLFPWTYQSMIHELLGISNTNNTVDLSHLNNVGEELRTVLMTETQDPFFSKSMYMNFGDLSKLLHDYVNEYKAKTKTNSDISSVKDMKFFLENYPQYKKMSLNLSKHMLLTGEIDKQIKIQRIWETSEFEQNMCSTTDFSHHDEDLKELEAFLFDKFTPDAGVTTPLHDWQKLKLLALYALKYETYPHNKTSSLLRTLNNQLFSTSIDRILKYCGHQQRILGEDGNVFNKAGGSPVPANHVAALLSNISGFNNHTDNVFMQFEPRINNLLNKITKGRLNSPAFTSIGNTEGDKQPPRDIIIFVIGGVCYEEARIIASLNKSIDGIRIVIGGTHIINSKTFMDNIKDMNF